jgi:hypothetical protein
MIPPWGMLLVGLALGAGLGAWYGRGGLGTLTWWTRRRKKPGERPYTQAEVEAADCFRCGSPGAFQWQVCADGNIWRPLCFPCDVELNRRTLEWMGHPDQHRLMLDYVTEAG